MNKEKIAKFIYENRKKQGLTQQEMADKLYVSANAISKWELGKCLPDVTTFERVAEVLDVSVAELVTGEEINNKNTKIYDDIIVSNMKENFKRIKKRNLIIISLISFIIISILSILIIFFYNNYNNITSFKFNGKSDNFEFLNGTATFSKKNYMIEISNFKLSENSTLDIDSIEEINISLLINGKEWAGDSYNSNEDENVSSWLANDLYFGESTSYECLNKNCDKGIFENMKKSEFPNNLEIIINYKIGSEYKEEIFEIFSVQIASNEIIN